MSRPTLVTLPEQLSRGQLVAPFVYDCLSARVAENTGFTTFALSLSGLAMAFGGVPDIGILTTDEVIAAVGRVADFLPYPVIAEFGGGFGDSVYVVWRNVLRLVRAGAGAVIIDDTANIIGTPSTPINNGMVPDHLPARIKTDVVDEVEYLARIRAAVDARLGSDCLVIAASNASYRHGIPEAIRRVRDAKELGADLVACRGITTIEDCRMLATSVDGPKMYDEFSATRAGVELNPEELRALDFRLVTVRYLEKAALYGLMNYGLRAKADNNLVYVDYHDFDGLLSGLDFHERLLLDWEPPGEQVHERPEVDGTKT